MVAIVRFTHLKGYVKTEHLDIFSFPPITQWCSVSDILFTGEWQYQILVFKNIIN